MLVCCDVPWITFNHPKNFCVFLCVGRYYMNMLVLCIRMPYYKIGLFPVAQIFDVLFGGFIEGLIVKMFPIGRAKTNVGILVLLALRSS